MGMTSGMLDLSNTDDSVTNFKDSGSAMAGGSMGASMSDAAMVSTSDQLKTYAAGMMHSNANVESVQSSNSSVSMNYKESGKLFGFIPTMVKVRSTTDANGNVSLSYPWYHFLVSTNDSTLKSDMESSIKSSVSGSASGTLSARMQAEFMADMATAFSSTSK
jgi:hypothetical protein